MNILSIGAGMRREAQQLGNKIIYQDQTMLPGIDMVFDLDEKPWPFPNGAFDKIIAFDVIEHLRGVIPAIEECHRILAPKGRLWIHTNDARNWRAFTDPTHLHFFTPESFDFFVPGTFLCTNYHWYSHVRFNKIDCHSEGNELIFELEKI